MDNNFEGMTEQEIMNWKVRELDNLIFPYFIDASEEKVKEIEQWCDGKFDIDFMRENLKKKRAVLTRALLVGIVIGNDKLDFQKMNYYWTILRNNLCGISRNKYKEMMGSEYAQKTKENNVRKAAWRLYKYNKLAKIIEYEKFKDYIEDIVPLYCGYSDYISVECAVQEDMQNTYGITVKTGMENE